VLPFVNKEGVDTLMEALWKWNKET